jgi:hypothetical protein
MAYEEFKVLCKDWHKKWKQDQEIRHEEWEQRRSYADRGNTSFEENLRKRIAWERGKKIREWRQYRLTIEKRMLANMTREEKVALYKYVRQKRSMRDK